jgi:hypothetical protein
MMDPSGMYILPARCIRCPLLVVPDIESSDTVSLEGSRKVRKRVPRD